jgi:hypothetical protein
LFGATAGVGVGVGACALTIPVAPNSRAGIHNMCLFTSKLLKK